MKCCASDKTGALWGDENTRKFLNAALPHRRELRKFRVPRDVYEEIAKVLNAQIKKEKRIDEYNHAQLRYKVKTLKQTYGEAKQGKHKGDRWIHFWLMYYIYDEDLGLSTSIALDNDQKRNSQFVPPLTPPALSVPNAVPSFVMAPLLSSTLQSTSGMYWWNCHFCCILFLVCCMSNILCLADVGMINAEAELSPILESLLTPSAGKYCEIFLYRIIKPDLYLA